MKFAKSRRIPAATLAAAAFAGGCGGSGEKSPKPQTSTSIQSRAQTQEYPFAIPDKVGPIPADIKNKMKKDPHYNSLMLARMSIIGGRRARVARGLCIVWASKKDQIVATVNPAMVKFHNKKGDTVRYPLYTETDFSDPPHVIRELPGPTTTHHKNDKTTFEGYAELIIFGSGGSVTESVRKLSEQPEIDDAGRASFMDAETGEPLMRTGYFNLGLTQENAEKACHAVLFSELDETVENQSTAQSYS